MDEDGSRSIEVRDSAGVIVGDGNTQINYTYNALTVTGGVAPPPLISVAGVESPYRGLNAFEDGEQAFFFGRDAAATDILARLADRGFLMVVGESGAGKSSLLRAGVVPRMRAESLAGAQASGAQGSRPWPCLVITPTMTPLDELAARMAPLIGADAAAIRRELAAEPRGFALTARQAAEGPIAKDRAATEESSQRHLVLVVDQFEELFTQCPDSAEDERRAFITALHAAATIVTGSAKVPGALVVLVVRADFEDRCARYELLADAVQHRYRLMPMTERQLRLAITEPAAVVGSRVEDDLVDSLLREVTWQADALPLLSYALDQAWRNKAGETLRLADYERVGGLEGSVAASAARAYAVLTEAQQAVVQQVFTLLTATNSEGQISAVRATRAELEAVADPDVVTAILEAFADKSVRLLTLGADSVAISHEVLLTAWDRLREWLEGDLGDRIRYTRLRADARTWSDNEGAASYLYSEGRLAEVEATERRWASHPGRYPPLDEVSAAFLAASRRVARQAVRRRRVFLAMLSALTLAAVVAAGTAVRFAVEAANNATVASQQHAIALSRQLAAESLSLAATAPGTARRLALAAWRISQTSQAAAALEDFLGEQQENGEMFGSPNGVFAVAFSPDSKLLATAESDGTQLWDVATGSRFGGLLRAQGTIPRSGSAAAVAFSPNGRLLASGDSTGYVQLWDTATRRLSRSPLADDPDKAAPISSVAAVAFSPDSKLLASADTDGNVKLWNVGTGTQVGRLAADTGRYTGMDGVAFSPDGRFLATAGTNGFAQIWSVATGDRVGKPLPSVAEQATQSVIAVAFSPDGRLLATGGSDGLIRFWNSATGEPAGHQVHAVNSPGVGVKALAFSPNGAVLASAGSDGRLGLWSPVTGQPVHSELLADPVATPPEGLEAVAFSPDGGLIASTDIRGVVRLWDAASYSPVGSAVSTQASKKSVLVAAAIASGGTLLTGPDSDGYLQVWNSAAHRDDGMRLPTDARKGGLIFTGQALSPDGMWLAAVNNQGYVQLWSTLTGRPIGMPMQATRKGPLDITDITFSRDEKLLATTSTDGYIRLWNLPSGRPFGKPILVSRDSWVDVVTFSPDGRLLAGVTDVSDAADHESHVRLWSVADGTLIDKPPMRGDADAVFSPDGKLLATAGSDGRIWVWDAVTQSLVHQISAAPDDNVNPPGGVWQLAFTPDGKLLQSGDGDGWVRLWDPSSGKEIGLPISAHEASGLPVRALAKFSPDGRVLAFIDDKGSVQPLLTAPYADPYAALCAEVGAPTPAEWARYASNEPMPNLCQV